MDRDRAIDLDASFRRVGSAVPTNDEQLHAPLLDKGTKSSLFAIQPAEGRSKPCPTGFNHQASCQLPCLLADCVRSVEMMSTIAVQ